MACVIGLQQEAGRAIRQAKKLVSNASLHAAMLLCLQSGTFTHQHELSVLAVLPAILLTAASSGQSLFVCVLICTLPAMVHFAHSLCAICASLALPRSRKSTITTAKKEWLDTPNRASMLHCCCARLALQVAACLT